MNAYILQVMTFIFFDSIYILIKDKVQTCKTSVINRIWLALFQLNRTQSAVWIHTFCKLWHSFFFWCSYDLNFVITLLIRNNKDFHTQTTRGNLWLTFPLSTINCDFIINARQFQSTPLIVVETHGCFQNFDFSHILRTFLHFAFYILILKIFVYIFSSSTHFQEVFAYHGDLHKNAGWKYFSLFTHIFLIYTP